MDLPDGRTWRRATLADAEAVFELTAACNLAVVGVPDRTLEDVRNDLGEPGFDLETDSWLVHDRAGALVGFAWTYRKGTGEQVDVDTIAPDDGVARWMYERVLARAGEMAAAGGHRQAVVDQGIYREDARIRALAQARGFRPATTFYRMRIDHDGAPAPTAPPGVTVHADTGAEDFRRTAHAVLVESFKDHFGWLAKPFEEWQDGLERDTTFDWSQLTVAELDARPVAIMVTTDQFVADEDCGYVADLGVLAEARGRGIAKYLLRSAFAADVAAGRTGTILHVDGNNTTPALGLYEGVGMRRVLTIDVFRRTVPRSGAAQRP
jgi:ribosomal protein S18 acetylase RimI-like enzyme